MEQQLKCLIHQKLTDNKLTKIMEYFSKPTTAACLNWMLNSCWHTSTLSEPNAAHVNLSLCQC